MNIYEFMSSNVGLFIFSLLFVVLITNNVYMYVTSLLPSNRELRKKIKEVERRNDAACEHLKDANSKINELNKELEDYKYLDMSAQQIKWMKDSVHYLEKELVTQSQQISSLLYAHDHRKKMNDEGGK